MTIFTQVKGSVDIIDAARKYGLTVNRNNKALCPYHEESRPSLSFKGARFTCFSCGASGDVIDLVGRLIGSEPLPAARELSNAYHLDIDVSKQVNSKVVMEARRRQKQKDAFKAWERDAANTYAAYHMLLRKWRRVYAPKSRDDTLDSRFVEAMTKLDYIMYICDAVFISGDMQIKQKFYCECKAEVLVVKERLEYARKLDTGQLLLWHPRIGVFHERYAA